MSEPLVSIGLPVYNGARYLREALDCLVNQEYRNLEIIISDNASTDETPVICQEYAARDSRIRYERSDVNRGVVWNFNRAHHFARGKYFAWMAHDDARKPSFIRRCVEELERSDAVMCMTGLQLIDTAGQPVGEQQFPYGHRVIGATARERLRAIARAAYWYDFYGVMRADVLATTQLCQPVWGYDVVLLTEMVLRGTVAYVPERLLLYRVEPAKSVAQVAAPLGNPVDGTAVRMSFAEMSVALLDAIRHAPLGALERTELTVEFLWRFNVGNALPRQHMTREDVHLAIERAQSEGNRRDTIMARLAAAATLPAGALERWWMRARDRSPILRNTPSRIAERRARRGRS